MTANLFPPPQAGSGPLSKPSATTAAEGGPGSAISPKTRVLGIDPSLVSTGLVVVDAQGKRIREKVAGTVPGEVLPRLQAITDQVLIMVGTFKPSLVVMEGLSYGSKGGMQFDRTGLHYVMRFLISQYHPALGKGIKIVPPTTLKKWVTTKGNSKKEDMKLAVFKRWMVDYSAAPNDLCDAYCLARWGLAFIAGDTDLPAKKKKGKKK